MSSQLTKLCACCRITKPLAEFGLESRRADGHRGRCLVCFWDYTKSYRSRPEVIARNSTPEVREKKLASRRRRKRKLLYGLSEEDIAAKVTAQGGGCAICGTLDPGGRYNKFVVDHCHATGRVRGMLCFRCNHTLGRMGDNYDGAMRFLRYLAKAEKRPIAASPRRKAKSQLGTISLYDTV